MGVGSIFSFILGILGHRLKWKQSPILTTQFIYFTEQLRFLCVNITVCLIMLCSSHFPYDWWVYVLSNFSLCYFFILPRLIAVEVADEYFASTLPHFKTFFLKMACQYKFLFSPAFCVFLQIQTQTREILILTFRTEHPSGFSPIPLMRLLSLLCLYSTINS